MSAWNDTVTATTELPFLSVVVIGRNEGERLRRCLQSVADMTLRGFQIEMIYVDSGSVDGSVALAQSMGATAIALQPERPTAALGRNAGWRAAKGTFILFLDGDTILHPEFVANSLPEFVDETVAVVWGHRREIHPERSLYNRILDLDWIYPPGPALFCGGDALFRKSVLMSAGGYDDSLIAGEEPELCRRIASLGFIILHVDHPMTSHDLAMMTWLQYWKRATRAGHAFAEVSERFQNTENPFWKNEALQNRRRAPLMLAVWSLSLVASLLTMSLLPVLAMTSLFLAVAIRSAWKARWKSTNPMTLVLYGLHSQLQQIPIYVGQMQYRGNRRSGRRSVLLEYKKP